MAKMTKNQLTDAIAEKRRFPKET